MPVLPLPDLPGLKFATPRNDDYPTIGPLQGEFSKIWLGKTFMPHQQFMADVMGEYDPETGIPHHRFRVGTLQRQVGKTDMAYAQKLERCFSVPGFRAFSTQQTGKDAAKSFLKYHNSIKDTPLAQIVQVLRGNGNQMARFPNGSEWQPHPPTEDGMHGDQSDDSDIDEVWAFTEEELETLLQAISPTQLTRPFSTLSLWSAGGTASSTALASLVARGRAGDPSICYFELGVPDDADINDLEMVASHNPAFGHTISMASLVKLRSEIPDDNQFARAAGNRWTEVIGGAIDSATWKAVRHNDEIPEGVPAAYGAARSDDGSQVVIAAAARIGSLVVCEVLEVVPAFGADARVKAWAATGLCGVVNSGGSKPLASSLERWRRLVPLSEQDYSAACGTLSDALPLRAYRFRQHIDLDAAVAVLGKRSIGDGGYVWARREAAAPVAAMEACTVAAHVLVTRPQRTGSIVAV